MIDGCLQWHSQKAEKIRTSKGNYWNKQWFSSIAPLFPNGNFSLRKEFAAKRERILSFKGSCFWYSKTTFTILGDLWMLLFLLRTCVTVQKRATPIASMYMLCLILRNWQRSSETLLYSLLTYFRFCVKGLSLLAIDHFLVTLNTLCIGSAIYFIYTIALIETRYTQTRSWN